MPLTPVSSLPWVETVPLDSHQLLSLTADCVLSVSEDSQLETKAGRRRAARGRKRKMPQEECCASESEEEVEIDRQLDQSLETKSRQHNLTSVNVKNIIHVSARAQTGRCSAVPQA